LKSDKKYKVVQIISNLSIGGAQILLFDIVNFLKKYNHLNITVITIDSGEYLKKFEESGIKVIDLSEKGLLNPRIYLKLKKILKEIKPDIVHTHLNKADFYGRLAAKSAGVQLIYTTCHNYSTTHSGADINRKSFFDFIDNIVIYYTDSKIIAISKMVKKYLINRNKNFDSVTEVIYNGVNIDKEKYKLNQKEQKFLKEKYCIDENDYVISLIGRLEKQKNHVFFLKSMLEIFSDYPGIKVIIAGEGTLKNDLKEFVKLNSLTDKVIFTSFVSNTEPLIEISDLICVPSLWEGFGLVIIEAMIKRKLVLASNVGGIPEIIEDSMNGFLYESENHEALKNKLKHIYKNRNALDEVKENGLMTVISKFDIQKNSELYYKSYLRKLGITESNNKYLYAK